MKCNTETKCWCVYQGVLGWVRVGTGSVQRQHKALFVQKRSFQESADGWKYCVDGVHNCVRVYTVWEVKGQLSVSFHVRLQRVVGVAVEYREDKMRERHICFLLLLSCSVQQEGSKAVCL